MTKNPDAADPVVELAKIRDQHNEVSLKKREVEQTPAAEAELREGTKRYVKETGARYECPVYTLAPGRHDFELIPIHLRSEVGRGPMAPDDRAAVEAYVCRFHAEEVLAGLGREIDAFVAEHGPGFTADERCARLEKIDQELNRLEVKEEAIIRRAARRGVRLIRRGDADPRIVLADLGDASPRAA